MEELELEGMIEVVQGRLSRNFNLLLSRLAHHDALLAQVHSSLAAHALAHQTFSAQNAHFA